MHTMSQDSSMPTPRPIFPLSPEMVRQLRETSPSQLPQVRKPTTDQQQTA